MFKNVFYLIIGSVAWGHFETEQGDMIFKAS